MKYVICNEICSWAGNVVMRAFNDYTDERNKGFCIHCGKSFGDGDVQATKDHVPSKALLRKPYPENLSAVEICAKCNHGFSLDEEYFRAFLISVLVGSTDAARQRKTKALRVSERSKKLRARIQKSKIECKDSQGNIHLVWEPEISRIENVIVKNARGHAFFEYGEPMTAPPEYVWAELFLNMTETQRKDFEVVQTNLWPEVNSRAFERAANEWDVQQIEAGWDSFDGWITVQKGVYRFSIQQQNSLIIRSVLREYLATEVCFGGA